MTTITHQAQLLAPAINGLLILDTALLELLTATSHATITGLHVAESYFNGLCTFLLYQLPSKEHFLAHTILICWALFGVALAASTLLGVASLMFTLASYSRHLFGRVHGLIQHTPEAPFESSASRITTFADAHDAPRSEGGSFDQRIFCYGRYADCSVLELVQTRNDMQMIERWKVRPKWSVWPPRVMRLLERREYDELKREIGRELNKGTVRRTCELSCSPMPQETTDLPGCTKLGPRTPDEALLRC